MVIVEVTRPQGARSQRRLRFDSGLALDVYEETYVQYALVLGRELDRAELRSITDADRLLGAKKVAMQFLARRMRTRHEVVERLRAKHFDEQAVDEAMRFLQRYGMIDDAAYASSYVNDRLLKRPIGRLRLEAELLSKGIDRHTIEDVLSEFDHEREMTAARAAAQSKRRSLRSSDPRQRERSLSTFLSGRGFTWEVIRHIVDEYRAHRQENDAEDR